MRLTEIFLKDFTLSKSVSTALPEFIASAPANIALVKYMGKTEGNLPTNSSLSYSLEHLRTQVRLVPSEQHSDVLHTSLKLSEKGRSKFLNHLKFLKNEMNQDEAFFDIYSENNFPSDAGFASSASSFAALTLAFREYIQYIGKNSFSLQEWSALSQKGSGSSCRSFYPRWSLWHSKGAIEVADLPQVFQIGFVIEEAKKEVSSSDAHKRVQSSLLFQGRKERAEQRLEALLEALKLAQWNQVFELCWAEFWDMHALFETSHPSFHYMTARTLKLLRELQDLRRIPGSSFFVTMDAGANVHVLSPSKYELQGLVQKLSCADLKVLGV